MASLQWCIDCFWGSFLRSGTGRGRHLVAFGWEMGSRLRLHLVLHATCHHHHCHFLPLHTPNVLRHVTYLTPRAPSSRPWHRSLHTDTTPPPHLPPPESPLLPIRKGEGDSPTTMKRRLDCLWLDWMTSSHNIIMHLWLFIMAIYWLVLSSSSGFDLLSWAGRLFSWTGLTLPGEEAGSPFSRHGIWERHGYRLPCLGRRRAGAVALSCLPGTMEKHMCTVISLPLSSQPQEKHSETTTCVCGGLGRWQQGRGSWREAIFRHDIQSLRKAGGRLLLFPCKTL